MWLNRRFVEICLLSTGEGPPKSVERAKDNSRGRPQRAPGHQCWLGCESDHINAEKISDYEPTLIRRKRHL